MNYERKVDSMDSLAGTESFYEADDNRRKRMLTIAAVALIAVILLGVWYAFAHSKGADTAAGGAGGVATGGGAAAATAEAATAGGGLSATVVDAVPSAAALAGGADVELRLHLAVEPGEVRRAAEQRQRAHVAQVGPQRVDGRCDRRIEIA